MAGCFDTCDVPQVSEIIELKWDRVDLIECYVDLTPDDTKTEEPRRIYFNSIKILKDVFIESGKNRKPSQYLVFTKMDGNPISKWSVQKFFKKSCIKVGVGPYRLHDLRHTFNTNMTKAGVDQVITMKLTGHKTNSMFIRYSHLDREQGEGAMDELSGFLSLEN